jgi:hypothetical protein
MTRKQAFVNREGKMQTKKHTDEEKLKVRAVFMFTGA